MEMVKFSVLSIFFILLSSIDVNCIIACLDEQCTNTTCPPLVRCNSSQELKIEGCNCCPTCVNVLQAGEQCNEFVGDFNSMACASGLTCVDNICTCPPQVYDTTTITTTTTIIDETTPLEERHRQSKNHTRAHGKAVNKHHKSKNHSNNHKIAAESKKHSNNHKTATESKKHSNNHKTAGESKMHSNNHKTVAESKKHERSN